MFTWLCVVSLIDLFAACQTVEPRDEEEVGPPPSPGYSYSRFQCGMRAAGQDEGITSSRIRFYPYLTARYMKNFGVPISKTAWGLFKLIPTTQSSFCLVKWNSVLIPCIPLSRIPLGGSGVDEWLETTGQMNHARVHVRRRRRYQRMPPWMVFCLILIGILYTYRKVS